MKTKFWENEKLCIVKYIFGVNWLYFYISKITEDENDGFDEDTYDEDYIISSPQEA